MKSFNSCKKNALKAGVTDPSELADCIGDDAKSKIAKACGKISGDVTKKCSGQDVAALFPGCGVATTGELTTCLEDAADCRSCAAIKLADGLEATCSACIPSGAIGTPSCEFDPRSWCIGGSSDGEPCTDGLANSDCPGNGNCQSNSSLFSTIAASSPNPLFDTPTTARMEYTIGTPDPVTGRTSVSCSSPRIDATDFGPIIGIVCQRAFPTPWCGLDGVIDCDGGETVDARYEINHDVDDCGLSDDPNETDPNNLAGPAECAASCQTHCAGLPGSFRVFNSSCEGYCKLGDKDGLICLNDLDCTVPNTDPNFPGALDVLASGECAGGEPVAHANRCQCECKEIDGGPSRPGAFSCEEGVITILESSAPCDDLGISLITKTCAARGTATFSARFTKADNNQGVILAPTPRTGSPASCRQLAQNNLGTNHMAGVHNQLDGGLGDQSTMWEARCQGPGFDLGQ
jgi:hypothetical protein